MINGTARNKNDVNLLRSMPLKKGTESKVRFPNMNENSRQSVNTSLKVRGVEPEGAKTRDEGVLVSYTKDVDPSHKLDESSLDASFLEIQNIEDFLDELPQSEQKQWDLPDFKLDFSIENIEKPRISFEFGGESMEPQGLMFGESGKPVQRLSSYEAKSVQPSKELIDGPEVEDLLTQYTAASFTKKVEKIYSRANIKQDAIEATRFLKHKAKVDFSNFEKSLEEGLGRSSLSEKNVDVSELESIAMNGLPFVSLLQEDPKGAQSQSQVTKKSFEDMISRNTGVEKRILLSNVETRENQGSRSSTQRFNILRCLPRRNVGLEQFTVVDRLSTLNSSVYSKNHYRSTNLPLTRVHDPSHSRSQNPSVLIDQLPVSSDYRPRNLLFKLLKRVLVYKRALRDVFDSRRGVHSSDLVLFLSSKGLNNSCLSASDLYCLLSELQIDYNCDKISWYFNRQPLGQGRGGVNREELVKEIFRERETEFSQMTFTDFDVESGLRSFLEILVKLLEDISCFVNKLNVQNLKEIMSDFRQHSSDSGFDFKGFFAAFRVSVTSAESTDLHDLFFGPDIHVSQEESFFELLVNPLWITN